MTCQKCASFLSPDGGLTRQCDEDRRSCDAALQELWRARDLWPPFSSPHEGFAILLEEVDELWVALRKAQKSAAHAPAMRREAVQVAAMALRFLTDCCYAGAKK